MKKPCAFIIGMLLITNIFYGQTAITLDECRQMAVNNYPLIKQYGLIAQAEKYTLSNITKSLLPLFGINAQATYQTDVTKLPIDLSFLPAPIDFPSVSKDQYKATIEASQTIWDGGIAHSQKKIAQATTTVEKQRVDVGLYAVKEKINQLYFGILSLDEQLKILDLTAKNLAANKDMALSMFNNGAAMQSDIDRIEVELLGLEQKRIEQKSLRNSLLKVLSLFIHLSLDETVALQKPQEVLIAGSTILRPELKLFSSQIALLNRQESAISAKNMPRINLFAQSGYSRPGLNMLDDHFDFFAIGGIKLSWNFGNLYTKKNEKKQLKNNINSVEIQQETFLFNTNVQLSQEQSEIQKVKELLEKDDEIIRLRNRVKTASESKYKNGYYPVNELIRDINDEAVARQSKALHEIQYLMNIYNYKQIKGEEE